LSIWQLHILLSITAQISLELHFCVELVHFEKALLFKCATAADQFAAYVLADKNWNAGILA